MKQTKTENTKKCYFVRKSHDFLKRLTAMLVAVSFVICFSSCAETSTVHIGSGTRSEREIIREMVTEYGDRHQDAEADVERLLGKLSAINPEEGERWQKIMDYWKYTADEMPINYGTLPAGLEDSDRLCIVVLGFQLNPDGTIRDELEGRLITALNCASQYPNAFVLCTGGGTAQNDPQATEAGIMAEWLTSNGLSPDRIIVEDKSLTTAQNAIFSFEKLRSEFPDVDSVAIVSSDYHIGWGSVLFETQFILAAEDYNNPPVSVVSNAAYFAEDHTEYPFSIQASMILEIAGLN